MAVKRYFEVPRAEKKTIIVDIELHTFLKKYAEDHSISIAEAIYLLIKPALAAEHGLKLED